MTSTEFNLSKEIEYGVELIEPIAVVELGEPVIKISKVKEFIRLLKEGCCSFVSAGAVCSVIDKIAGENLTSED